MTDDRAPERAPKIIATIENRRKPGQVVEIRYLPEEGAFVTSGIESHFAEKEIMIPSHLVIEDLQLMGTIVSALLEKLSEAQDGETAFSYASHFEALGRFYLLKEGDRFVHLSPAEEKDHTKAFDMEGPLE